MDHWGIANRSLYGGGARRRYFHAPSLKGLLNDKGEVLNLTFPLYDLHKYVAAPMVAGELAMHEGAIAGDLPLAMMVDVFGREELKDLCGVHAIDIKGLYYRDSFTERLRAHQCGPNCRASYCILIPSTMDLNSTKAGIVDVTTDAFTKCFKNIRADALKAVFPQASDKFTAKNYRVKRIYPVGSELVNEGEVMVQNWPIPDMVQHLSLPGIRSLAAFHGLHIPAEWVKEDCQWMMTNHICGKCPQLSVVFTFLTPKSLKISAANRDEKFEWFPYTIVPTSDYPPAPASKRDLARTMRAFCDQLKPEAIEEVGCAVCAQLKLKKDMTPLAEYEEYLHVLENPDVTRVLRESPADPPSGQVGPVTIPGLTGVCQLCAEALVKGHRPKLSLANGLWVGDVPDVLKELTLAEQTLISRVRHNRCVVRVASGHAKMSANVIAFEHPTMKIYERLPIRREDLDEVLAVIYTGVAAPTTDDLKRTPVLVRRNKVKDALEWLKLNNACYADLAIDYEVLASYPLNDVPVEVLHQKSEDSGNVEPAATSQFDNDDEQGTESGPCPFTVHGLTGTHYSKMTTTQRKAAALQHLKNGGSMLAVGHSGDPQSMYNNPNLYPAMFPWLFPHGMGGVGQETHAGVLSRDTHVRWLLMYHDKRFQEDAAFVIVAFNHQLIRQSTTGSFMLVKRNNFTKLSETIQRISPYVLSHISEQMKKGGKFVPQTREEKECFSVLDQIEYVGGHVNGSIASKKYMRNQLWSLVAFKNAPHWFITLSPADNKHPLCIYLASHNEKFIPEIVGYAERQHLVTRNPVACARFFDYLIKLFISIICGWKDDLRDVGVFGQPSAYYGTVEQQGRMTLHLHHLLWIEGSLPPQVVRDKLTGPDSEFQKKLIAYLESCRIGEFMTGSMAEVSDRVPHIPENTKNKGIHTILSVPESPEIPPGYQNPTLTMPEAPPENCCDEDQCVNDECPGLYTWFADFAKTVDDIVFRSNIHKCFGRKDNAPSRDEKKKLPPPPKQHATGKGCVNKDGMCTARFPRDTYDKTSVDPVSGHVDLKKGEPWINDITPLIAALFKCNTDTTCLLSGTAVKATLGYITDYITKGWLKTHQIFSIMHDTFTRNPRSGPESDEKPGNAARRMILRVVNSLSAKMEIGAPMAALYLLGNPDHYTSHEFRVFYWKNYVNFVETEWQRYMNVVDPSQLPTQVTPAVANSCDVGITRSNKVNKEITDMVEGHERETLLVQRSNQKYVGKSTTDDYRCRPTEHDPLCLYEWIQCSLKVNESTTRAPRKSLLFYPYQPDHPLHESHLVACDLDRREYVVPNFIGPALPKREGSDREQYCCTMLVFFRPWRTGIDLKAVDETWEVAFDKYNFTERQKELMSNFNLRYECYDARDDYPSLFKSASKVPIGESDDENDDLVDCDKYEDEMGDDDDWLELKDGPKTMEMQSVKDTSTRALKSAGWKVSRNALAVNDFGLPKITIDRNFNSSAWKSIIKGEKNKIWQAKFKAAEVAYESGGAPGPLRNDAYVVPASYLTKEFVPQKPEWATIINDIATRFSLNKEQRKAFDIVANHATCVAPPQLLMHLGGMGGTGKSQVIRSLEAYFKARGEPYRLVLLGPTGTSAALIGGSTYHSFLGLRTSASSGESPSSFDEVLERLIQCGYIFLDESSMLACRDLCRISARICEVLNIYEQPFGGLNVILAGDFAQLPPPKGISLYRRAVTLKQTPRQTPGEQETIIGKMIWMQFTTVVILKENMRQTGNQPEEIAFRQALVNLRYYSCSPDDIALIRSRLAKGQGVLSLDNEKFRDVSIITSRNRVKDQYNECNVSRFAMESGQTVSEFYSMDKLSHAEPKRTDENRVYAHVTHLSRALKNILWDQPPNTSEQVAACLKLCLGMPVIVRYNEATELCITRGQEGRVVGWTSSQLGTSDLRQVLDVLYVELVNPPKSVKLPNLPKNVVPLTKISQSVEARLPSDEYVCIARNQVPCLPNFAMTDYSAQGKTREMNVIDIADCRNFQAAYTCLSRGTSLGGTLILRDFPNNLLKGDLSGDIRQEYRELDLLDTVTDLQYEGHLATDFTTGTRWGTIDKFRELRGIPVPADEVRGTPKSTKRGGQPVKEAEIKYEIHTLAAQNKRKHAKHPVSPKKKRKTTTRTMLSNDPMLAPVGPIWDGADHSCAFDSLYFVFYWLWFSNTRRWGPTLTNFGRIGAAAVRSFEGVNTHELEPELVKARDSWRTAIREIHPGQYPVSHEGADILELSRRLCGVQGVVRNKDVECLQCGRKERLRHPPSQSLGRYNICVRAQSVHDWVDEATLPVAECELCGGDVVGQGVSEELLCFDLASSPGVEIQPQLTVLDGRQYRLVGIVYFGNYHFVSRMITAEGKIYLHDGIQGAYSTSEGTVGDDDFEGDSLRSSGSRSPSLAFYVEG